jgi:hypothetical protein
MLAALAGCRAVPTIHGAVERIDIAGTVAVTGQMDVHETIAVAPAADGTLVFEREITSRFADNVTFVSASADGAPLVDGSDGFSLDAAPDRLRLTWRQSSRARTTTIDLAYRFDAAVRVREPRGRLEWPVLAAGESPAAAAVTIALRLPDTAQLYDGTGMAEAGWAIDLVPGGLNARRAPLAAGEPATLLAVFDIDHQRVVQPRWELDLDRQAQYFFALLSAGAFILVVGAGILIQLRVQYPPVAAAAPPEAAGEASAIRRMLGRNLRISALVAGASAMAGAWCVWLFLPGLGPAAHAIPVAVAVVALMFLVAGWHYRRTA